MAKKIRIAELAVTICCEDGKRRTFKCPENLHEAVIAELSAHDAKEVQPGVYQVSDLDAAIKALRMIQE